MSDDKMIGVIKDDIQGMEESIAKLFSMFTEQFGVVIEGIDVDSGPVVWNQGERGPRYSYRIKFKTTLK